MTDALNIDGTQRERRRKKEEKESKNYLNFMFWDYMWALHQCYGYLTWKFPVLWIPSTPLLERHKLHWICVPICMGAV